MTEETKRMVIGNIRHLLNSFIGCSEYENVIFCWVMHDDAIIDMVLDGLDTSSCEVMKISLTCDEKTLVSRLEKDIAAGIRQADIIERSVSRLTLFEGLDTLKIDTTGKTPEETALKIAGL